MVGSIVLLRHLTTISGMSLRPRRGPPPPNRTTPGTPTQSQPSQPASRRQINPVTEVSSSFALPVKTQSLGTDISATRRWGWGGVGLYRFLTGQVRSPRSVRGQELLPLEIPWVCPVPVSHIQIVGFFFGRARHGNLGLWTSNP